MSRGFSAEGGRRHEKIDAASTVTALMALLALLLALGLSGSACAKKAEPHQPSEGEQAITEYQHGVLLLDSGRYEEAIVSFRKALELDERNILCHYCLALAYFRVGQFEQAMSEADRALELKPDYTEVHNIKGMIYNEQGEYLKAMESFRRLLDAPSYGKPWVANYNLGFAAASAGNQEEALYYYTRSLEAKDDYVQARQQRALMLERLGREAEAIVEYEIVLIDLPDSAEVHFSLGRLYFRAGQPVEARLNFEWVMRYAPGSGYASQAAKYINRMGPAGQ